MPGRLVLASAVATAVLAAAPTVAQAQDGKTVTATGTGQARVHPRNRHSSPSIAAAVDAARKVAIKSALSDAHEYALDYAHATRLTLGGVISVSDSQANGFYGPGVSGAFIGPFGPNQYCGTLSQIIGRPVRGKKPKFKKVHRCIVPRFAYTTLTVTYSAS
jgi:hypothetical protein